MSDGTTKEHGSRLALQDLLPRHGVQGSGARPQVIFGIVDERTAADRDRTNRDNTNTETEG